MQLHRGAYIVIYKSGSVQNVTRLCTEWNVLAQIGEPLYVYIYKRVIPRETSRSRAAGPVSTDVRPDLIGTRLR